MTNRWREVELTQPSKGLRSWSSRAGRSARRARCARSNAPISSKAAGRMPRSTHATHGLSGQGHGNVAAKELLSMCGWLALEVGASLEVVLAGEVPSGVAEIQFVLRAVKLGLVA